MFKYILIGIGITIAAKMIYEIVQMIYLIRKTNKSLEGLYAQLQFYETGEMDEKWVQQRFDNVTLLIQVQEREEAQVEKIFDFSLYEKMNIVGLTYYMRREDARELASDKLEEIAQQFELDDEEVGNIVLQSIAVQPQSTVIQMKDGTWLWRMKSG